MEESKPEIKGEDLREGRARGGAALARTKSMHVLCIAGMDARMDQGSQTGSLFRGELRI